MRNFSSRRRRMSGGADESLVQGKNFINNQAGGGAVLHGAPVLTGGDAMLLDGDLRGKAGMGSLDASTAAIRGMQDGGRRRGRNNMSARRRRNNNMSARRRRNNNMSARRRRNNNMSARHRRNRNNASARRSRRNRNNASARRNRRRRNNNMYGGDGEEEYLPEEEQYGGDGEEEYLPEEEQYGGEGEVYEDAVTPVQRRSRNMYGGAHRLLPADYASVNQSPALISGGAAARAGTAFTNDPFANGSGSA